jgi:pimeloyl-CoA dehydrogenase small subunit
MDFDLDDGQRLLRDSLGRLLADHGGFARRAAHAAGPDGWSRELWRRYAELGLLGLPFAERHGGVDGGPIVTMIAMEAFGRALAIEPFLATVVLGGGLLRHGARDELAAALAPRVAAGETILAFAHVERQSRWDLADVATTATRDDGGWRLDGEKSVVLHGDSADLLAVTVRVGGGPRDRDGVAVFLVDARAPGVSRRGYPTQDGMRAAEIALARVRVGPGDALGEPGAALPLVERVVDEAIAALCAEAVGAMAALHELTVEHLKTRRQFGVAIGGFQALQHRAVDMLVAVEQARSMALYATMMVGDPDPDSRRRAVAAAKVQVGRSARFVGEQATQLHGGIGMTMEYRGGHLFKRLAMIDAAFGDADHHLRALARGPGLYAGG